MPLIPLQVRKKLDTLSNEILGRRIKILNELLVKQDKIKKDLEKRLKVVNRTISNLYYTKWPMEEILIERAKGGTLKVISIQTERIKLKEPNWKKLLKDVNTALTNEKDNESSPKNESTESD